MIHVAVLLKPYLDLILQGRKTVECRLTKDARDPYENIEPGERIYFKLSAGPYAATALVDHVLFEADLTPRRVNEIRRDYNDQICGEQTYWEWKRDARYCTLIWLRDVMPIDNGPKIRPLQGVAWLTLDEEPAWRNLSPGAAMPAHGPAINVQPKKPRKVAKSSAAEKRRLPGQIDGKSPSQQLGHGMEPPHAGSSFAVEVTPGNVRNNTLYVTSVAACFPRWAFGGARRDQAGQPLTLMLHDGPTVQTDIVGPRNMLRTRVWGRWFRQHGVKPGDRVVFTLMSEGVYSVGLTRS